jgi:hypothetical protein
MSDLEQKHLFRRAAALAKVDAALAQAKADFVFYCDRGNLPAVKDQLDRIDTLLERRFAFVHVEA